MLLPKTRIVPVIKATHFLISHPAGQTDRHSSWIHPHSAKPALVWLRWDHFCRFLHQRLSDVIVWNMCKEKIESMREQDGLTILFSFCFLCLADISLSINFPIASSPSKLLSCFFSFIIQIVWSDVFLCLAESQAAVCKSEQNTMKRETD